ncbi:MAG: metallopeptidase family protein [Nitrospirota bacterium]
MSFIVSRKRFEELTEEALAALPDEFRQYLTNVTVIVEDYPGREDAHLTGVPRDELLGLFRGIAHQDKGGMFDIPPPLPDEVILFQKNIQEICSSEEELIDEIRITLIHEIGHYFGFSEEELEQYEG